MNPKQQNEKDATPTETMVQTQKTKDKEDVLKAIKEKNAYYLWRTDRQEYFSRAMKEVRM